MRAPTVLRSALTLGCAGALTLLALVGASTGRADEDVPTLRPRRHAPPRPRPRRKPRAAPIDAGARPPPPEATFDPPLEGVVDAGRARDAGAPSGEDEEDDDDEDRDAAPDAAAAPAARARSASGSKRADRADASAAAAAAAEDDDDDDEDDDDWDYDLGAEVDVASRLVWRGVAESRGAVIEPAAWAGFYGLTATGWASNVLNAEAPRAPLSAVAADASLSYAFTIERLRFEPAFTYFYFPDRLFSGSTAEAALDVSYKIGDVRLRAGNNVDIAARPGAFFGTLGVAYRQPVHTWTFDAFASAGWATSAYNLEYFGRDVTAINVVQAGASARLAIGDVFYVAFHTEASTLVAPILRASVVEPTFVVGGMAFGVDYSAREPRPSP